MTTETRPQRPRSFADDWAFRGTPAPPGTIANPMDLVRPSDRALRPAPLGARWTELAIEDLVGSPFVDHNWGGIDLSPDGSEVAFAWDRTGNFEICAARVFGARIYQLTEGTQRSVWPRYSPDGTQIAFLRDVDGDERFQVWLMRNDGRRQRDLTSRPEVSHRDIEWSPDGTRIAFVANSGGRSYGLEVLDVATGARRALSDGSADDSLPRWSPDGRWIAFTSRRDVDRTISDLYLVPAEGGEPRLLDTRDGRAAESLDARWSPDGSALAFTTNVRGRYEIAVARLDDAMRVQRVEILTNTPFDSTEPVWRPDGRGVRYLHSRESSVSVRQVLLASHADSPVMDLPGVHKTARVGADSETTATVYSGARRPWDVWVRPPRATRPFAITSSLPAHVDPAVLVEPIHVRYPAADGREIPALLYLPHSEAMRGDGPPPAIVHVHGGPTGQHFFWWDATSQWFAHRGYVVLAPNIRGSTGYGREFQEANRGDWGGKDLGDVVSGVDWLAREGVAAKGRIGAYGGSYGGFMTMYALAKAPERWAAGVSVVGVVSWRTMYDTTRGDLRTYLEREFGDPAKQQELYRDRSPITHVRSIRAPLLILQGANDPRVPLSEAEAVVNALREGGRTYDYHVYPDEGHGFRRNANKVDAIRRATEWFDKHLRRA